MRIDRREAYRSVFEDWRYREPLVDRVLRRETSFTEEMRMVREIVGNSLTPKYFSKNELELLMERSWISDGISTSRFNRLVLNPVGFGAPFGLLGGGATLLADGKTSRRDLLIRSGIFFVAFYVSFGGFFGTAAYIGNAKGLERAEADGKYLDELIKEEYV